MTIKRPYELILFLLAFAFVPLSPVQADACGDFMTQIGGGVGECKPKCPDTEFWIEDLAGIPPFTGGSDPCIGTFCCIQQGGGFCTVLQNGANKSGPSGCQSGSCPAGSKDFKTMTNSVYDQGVSGCSGNYYCCVDSSSTPTCIDGGKLPGVPNICKPKGQLKSDEFDARGRGFWSTKFKDSNNACPDSQDACAIQKGSKLCEAIARDQNREGYLDYQCGQSSKCVSGTEVEVDDTAVPGGPCTGGQVCCRVTEASQEQTPSTPAASGPSGPAAAGKVVTLPDPLGGVTVPQLVGGIIRAFAGIAGSIALIMFVWGGIQLVISGGTQDKVTAARKTLVNAAIGIVLIFAAYTFVSAIIDAIVARPT